MVRIVHLLLNVENVDSVRSFCEKVFGFTALAQPKKNGVGMTDGAMHVAVDKCRPESSPGISHLGVEVENVDEFVAEIRKYGCEIFTERTENKKFRIPGGSGIVVEIVPKGKPWVSVR